MPYEHIRISRDEPVRERHRRLFVPPSMRPDDARAFGAQLKRSFDSAKTFAEQEDIGGYDDRLLLKLTLREGALPPELEAIEGISVVSQEDKTVILAFANQRGLDAFEGKLATLVDSGTATRANILFAIDGFDHWTPENRTGTALREHGLPQRATFLLDIELWPLENPQQRTQLQESFIAWATEQGIEITDSLIYPSLVMVRVRAETNAVDLILNHRDVRTVDLPPRVGLDVNLLTADINQFPEIAPPPQDAPRICVLDSGITAGHPLLGAAVGDAQGYVVPGRDAADNPVNGHGTFVAGIALYGDVAANITAGQFIPDLQLFSGRVFADDDADQTKFVEKSVDEAVHYFQSTYQCRVFNLSYGDRNKVYDGKHIRGLAYVLDKLTRELGVLFVVPTGNLTLAELPANPVADYPAYLLTRASRLIDPATALNALTVGGLATLDTTFDARRNEHTFEDLPIAQQDQPSPITRSGFSVGAAIKPDLVAAAGNVAFVPSRSATRT